MYVEKNRYILLMTRLYKTAYNVLEITLFCLKSQCFTLFVCDIPMFISLKAFPMEIVNKNEIG